jgi:hypothetical protein
MNPTRDRENEAPAAYTNQPFGLLTKGLACRLVVAPFASSSFICLKECVVYLRLL